MYINYEGYVPGVTRVTSMYQVYMYLLCADTRFTPVACVPFVVVGMPVRLDVCINICI